MERYTPENQPSLLITLREDVFIKHLVVILSSHQLQFYIMKVCVNIMIELFSHSLSTWFHFMWCQKGFSCPSLRCVQTALPSCTFLPYNCIFYQSLNLLELIVGYVLYTMYLSRYFSSCSC